MAGPNAKLDWYRVSNYTPSRWTLSVGHAIRGESEVHAVVFPTREGYSVEIYRRTYGEIPGSPVHGYTQGETLLPSTPAKTLQAGKKMAEVYLICHFPNDVLPWREGTLEYERYVRPRLEAEEQRRRERDAEYRLRYTTSDAAPVIEDTEPKESPATMPEPNETTITVTLNAQDAIDLCRAKGVNSPSVLRAYGILMPAAENAINTATLRARVPRIIPEVKSGASLLWEKDSEDESGNPITVSSELKVAEVLYMAQQSSFRVNGGMALVRLEAPLGECGYLVVTQFPRGWGASALCVTEEQAWEWVPMVDEENKVAVREYLRKRIDLIADTEGIDNDEKQRLVQRDIFGSRLMEKLPPNYAHDVRYHAEHRHIFRHAY